MLRRTLLLFLLACPLAAQEQRISRIEVRGNVPASIVVSQSALAEGRSYSEGDIDAGVARVRRLPFVYDARYTIEGETLRIEVTGVTPLFGEIDAVATKSELDDDAAAAISAGGRHFLGAGVVEARATTIVGEGDDPRSVELQYSHYAIGGTRLFATAGATLDLADHDDAYEPDPTLQLALGYPLTVRQTLSGSAFRTGSSMNTAFEIPVESTTEIVGLQLRWTFDTTDDPFFARRGTLLEAGPSWTQFESKFEFSFVPPPPFEPITVTGRERDDIRSLAATARHVRPVRARGALFGEVAATFSDRESELRTNDDPPITAEGESRAVRLAIGYGHNFFDRDAAVQNGRHRVEITAVAARFHNESPELDTSDDQKSLLLGYVYRMRFARVKATLVYAFD